MEKGTKGGIRAAACKETTQHEGPGHSRHHIFLLDCGGLLSHLVGIQQVMSTN